MADRRSLFFLLHALTCMAMSFRAADVRSQTSIAKSGCSMQRRQLMAALAAAVPTAASADFAPAPGSLAALLNRNQVAKVGDSPTKPKVDDTGGGDFLIIAPTGDFLFILNAQLQMDEVAAKLAKPGYALNDEDRIAELQLMAFSFKPTRTVLEKMVDKFGPLRALKVDDRATAAELAGKFAAQLLVVEDACRARAPAGEQVDALRAASSTLSEFLKVAATKYDIPKLEVAPGAAKLL